MSKARRFFTSYGFIYIIALTQVLVSLGIQSQLYINRDLAIHLDVARRLLAGEWLYKDIILANLPFQYWFRVPPVWLAGVSGFNLIWVDRIYTNLFAAVSIILCIRLMRGCYLKNEKMVFACVLNGLVFILFLSLLSPITELGQKEHSILIFSLPYIFACIRRLEITLSPRLHMLTSLLMLVACLFKPHYILVFVAAEVFIAVRNKNLRSIFSVVNFIFCAGFIACAALVYYGTAYRDISNLLPLYLYSSGNYMLFCVQKSFKYIVAAFLGMAFYNYEFPNKKIKPQLYLLGALIAATVPAVALQMKGWNYHFIVMNGYFTLLLFLLAGLSLSTRNYKSSVMIFPILLCLLVGNNLSKCIEVLRIRKIMKR